MPVSSRSLVEFILLGPTNDRRQLQDSPILGDVWIAYALKPTEAVDLLITPNREQPAGPVAFKISKLIGEFGIPREPKNEAQVAYLQGLVAARLYFKEVFHFIVPMTRWWNKKKVVDGLSALDEQNLLKERLENIIRWAKAKNEDERVNLAETFADPNFKSLARYAALTGIILWASKQTVTAKSPQRSIGEVLTKISQAEEIVATLDAEFKQVMSEKGEGAKHREKSLIWQVSLNRRAMPAVNMSVPSVKGDAARGLFNVQCKDIAWAILDSGIDRDHEVFKLPDGNSRVVQSYDFSNIRQIVSLDNLDMDTKSFEARLGVLRKGREDKVSEEEAREILKELAEDADNDRPIHWEKVEKFIVGPLPAPLGGHGTHVAGILGAKKPDGAGGEYADGMCPDIKLYDFRVLAKSLEETEFAIIAALQYIRYLNERRDYMSIHGANLSLSIPHDVRNYACGRTPICVESERLVESGIVVVAAAGNLGYQRFETAEGGSYEGYTAFSITDPGNADGVITVGATHRNKPHSYGVSFFSSRGPTGDGRLKPDLVAPGERIESSLVGDDWGELDGTSMAAPHVSGAAAMLMARYTELIGEPRKIKRILCESATDLGRERSFQGHGMLDVLRAFQSI